ncbi:MULTISPECIES: copper chaperone PCu(A)C [unclassified Bordetella]|uniref:copper chaperone PCu(A)C n=1 Tax=unclassified Bordetella TaxID=2630031 RepID=UPI00132A3E91|nr:MULTISPECIES: copper chaperone PCu(A)C [unclassified Bordetella]MVW71420.1 copper chaperone PCu(A)C [Bordetella sp. 15P40C-2]MVW79362.1 copper chaperone PCu(A)C [Bordetella sp. 02P26C-1]
MNFRQWALAATLGLSSIASAWAHDYTIGQIRVDHPWVRATAPGQANGAGYMEIKNSGANADRLLSVNSDAAARVELHTIETENGVARMRHVPDGIAVPANGEVKLAPGGYHVMFLNLKQPFSQDGEIPATLKFEKAGEVAVKFHVMPIGHMQKGEHDHSSHSMKH